MNKKLIWILAAVMFGTMCWLIGIQSSWFKSAYMLRQEHFSEQVMHSLGAVVSELEKQEVVLQLSNEVIAVSFDSVPSFSDDVELDRNSHVLVDSLLKDSTKKETIVAVPKDSLFYAVTDSTDRTFYFDAQCMNLHEFQDKIRQRVHRNKTIFVENLVNNLIRKKVEIEKRVSPEHIKEILTEQLRNNGINIPFKFQLLRDDKTPFYSSCPLCNEDNELNVYEIALFPNDIISPKCYLSVRFPEETMVSMLSMQKQVAVGGVLTLIIISIFVITLVIIFRQKKLSEMKTDFVNNMTHELKTPIASISLASQMLKDTAIMQNPKSFSQISSVIEQESKRLGFQVERVLQMATIEKGRAVMKIKEIYVNELIKKVVNSFALKVKDRGGEVIFSAAAKDDMIDGDEVHITNLISNLLDNALKYSKDEPKIRITTCNLRKGVEITVSDNGIGISHDDQKRIFEQFFRVHTGNVHDVKGFGIGLSYVKKIVEEHRGTIKLKSEPGKGTTFFVFLPFTQ
ncbi:MAG: HAMP domain-containing histidine kinase [Bacteroidales bacterium]|jgi:signal transduction histidine kinase|nr:HAMP domain-containing histidine kinase [Bacteroidales bacterium]